MPSGRKAGFDSALVAAHDQAAAVLAEVDQQDGVAQGRHAVVACSRNGCVTRYWCDIGIIGTRTPAIRPISAANIPPALTTTSASIRPLSVSTARARPALDLDPGHAGVLEHRQLALATGDVGERVGELAGSM